MPQYSQDPLRKRGYGVCTAESEVGRELAEGEAPLLLAAVEIELFMLAACKRAQSLLNSGMTS